MGEHVSIMDFLGSDWMASFTSFLVSFTTFLIVLAIGLGLLANKYPRQTRALAEWVRRRPFPDDTKNDS